MVSQITQREWHRGQTHQAEKSKCTGLEADPRTCGEAGVGEAETEVGRARRRADTPGLTGLHTHPKGMELILRALGKPVEILKQLSDVDRNLKIAGGRGGE